MNEFNPAENLKKRPKLGNGWTVIEKMDRPSNVTGSTFSVGYIVVNDNSGDQAFLKALDFSTALKQPDPTRVIQVLAETFNYEKKILEECRTSRLDRVALSVADGEIPVGELHESLPVPYLIFDLAEGDIRSKLDMQAQFDLAFCLRALHHCATGLRQLHNRQIAHQDLKPSNVLVYSDSDCKLGDLGSSAYLGVNSPRDEFNIAGDHTYAPPELLYGEVSQDWRIRRLSCDLYHLGSLAVFLFTKVGITAMWKKYLVPTLQPRQWLGSYKSVLPHVRNAHDLAFLEFEDQIPEGIRDTLGESVRQLCDPNPHLRGHPRNRSPGGNPYALERYVSRFNLLARNAELGMMMKM